MGASGVDVDGSNDASDGAVEHAPCPIGASFPLGTYHLQTLVSYSSVSGDGNGNVTDFCGLSRSTETMQLTEEPHFPGIYDLDLDANQPGGPRSFYSIDVNDENGVTHIHSDACFDRNADCPFDVETLDLDIDDRTGIVKNFVLTYAHVGPYPSTLDFVENATGWPVCPASTASPPTWIAAPKQLSETVACYGISPALGCSSSYTYLDNTASSPPPPSTCPSNTTCTCTNKVDGYEVDCCN
jgi:hypothetical protein